MIWFFYFLIVCSVNLDLVNSGVILWYLTLVNQGCMCKAPYTSLLGFSAMLPSIVLNMQYWVHIHLSDSTLLNVFPIPIILIFLFSTFLSTSFPFSSVEHNNPHLDPTVCIKQLSWTILSCHSCSFLHNFMKCSWLRAFEYWYCSKWIASESNHLSNSRYCYFIWPLFLFYSMGRRDNLTILYPPGCREVTEDLSPDELIRRLKTLAHTLQSMGQDDGAYQVCCSTYCCHQLTCLCSSILWKGIF